MSRISTEIIANRQLLFILFIMRTTIIISTLPVLTAGNAAQDAWASSLVSYVGSAILATAIGALGTRFPDLTLIQYGQKLIGRIPGKILSLVYLWAFLWVAAVDLRIYSEVLVTAFFPATPLVFIAGTMAVASAYAAYAGIEAIGRNADFVFPIFSMTILASLLAATPQIQLTRLQPVLARGLKPVLVGSITPMAITLQVPVITVIAPSVLRPKKVVKTTIWALTAAHLVLTAASLVAVGVLGAEPAARSVFPFFRMIRAIRLTEFLERFEALVILPWGLGMFIGLSTSLYCCLKGLSQVFDLSDYRPLVGPMAAICITLSIHAAADIFQLRSFFRPETAGPYALFLMLAPPAVLWPAYLARRWMRKRPGSRKGGRQR